MSYVVIARRWRPQLFGEIVGQDHVSKTLSNAIANNRIAHAYIFTGPRGVGKTTAARILAKAVNCEKGPTPTPCNECASCKAIITGNAMDVLEIDGASNRGIDEVRNLRENIRFTPSLGKYRIYIIDEVHMLTKEAFNALLKTLEEPPAHALFIFATTEIHKVPATILSRCQRFDFKRIPLTVIMDHLRKICATEKIEIEEDALLQIAKKADGSMRDSQSILDQIISYSGTKITFTEVAQALGVINQDEFFRISDLVHQSNLRELILVARRIFSAGYDLNEFLLGLEEHFRNILVCKMMGSPELIDVSENYRKRYTEVAGQFSENDLVGYLKVLVSAIAEIKWSQQPHLKFELGLIRLAKMPASADVSTILEKLDLLKKKVPAELKSDPDYPELNPDLPRQLSLDSIKQEWEAIRGGIFKGKPTLASLFDVVKLKHYGEGILHIHISSPDHFHLSLMEKNKAFIESVISDTLQTEIKLKVTQEQGEETIKRKENQQEEKRKRLERIKSEHPNIATLIDEFDMELI